MADTGASLVGQDFPAARLFDGKPDNVVETGALVSGKTVVFVGVPGAFTPTCNNTHLPGFLERTEEFKAAGVDEVVCVAVNDPFVQSAWGKSLNADGKVRFLADTQLELTKALGIELDASALLGNVRCKRFAAVVKNGKIAHMAIEPTGGGLDVSAADKVLEAVKA